jgi:hypothetical protein
MCARDRGQILRLEGGEGAKHVRNGALGMNGDQRVDVET